MKSRNYQAILFLTALLFFSIFIPMGNIPSDTKYSVETAVSLCEGKLNIDPSLQLQNLKKGRYGNYYSQYGIGYALLFIPAALIANVLSPVISHQYVLCALVSCTNTFLASLIIMLMFRLFFKMGYNKKTALTSVLSIATASILLPYSKINHAEIPTIVVLMFFLLTFQSTERLSTKKGFTFSILAAALLFLKIGNVIYCVCIIGTGFFYLSKRLFTKGGLVALISMPVLAIIFLLIFNKYRFFNCFDFGYGSEQAMFTMPLLEGLELLFFSPSKSMILFSPLILLSFAGMYMYFKYSPRLVITVAAMAAGNIIFYSLWHDWHGGWSWGPRLIVPSIVLLHVFLPEFIKSMKTKILRFSLFITLLLFGISINVLGSCIWYQQIYYFHKDYNSIQNSHVLIAAKIFNHKLRNTDEVYPCSYMSFDCKNNSVWNDLIRKKGIDFSDFETFNGFAVFWSGLHRNLGIPFLWCIPLILLSLVVYGCIFLWRTPIKETSTTIF